jgi:hypothetical protein
VHLNNVRERISYDPRLDSSSDVELSHDISDFGEHRRANGYVVVFDFFPKAFND